MTVIYAKDTPEGDNFYPGYYGRPGDIADQADPDNYDVYYALYEQGGDTWEMTPGTGGFALQDRSVSYAFQQDADVVFSQIADAYYTFAAVSGSAELRISRVPAYDVVAEEGRDLYYDDWSEYPWEDVGTITVSSGAETTIDATIPTPAYEDWGHFYLVECISGAVTLDRVAYTLARTDGVWEVDPDATGHGPWINGHLDSLERTVFASDLLNDGAAVVTTPYGIVHDLGYPGYYPAFTFSEMTSEWAALKSTVYGASDYGPTLEDLGLVYASDAEQFAYERRGTYVTSGITGDVGGPMNLQSNHDLNVFPLFATQKWTISRYHTTSPDHGSAADYGSLEMLAINEFGFDGPISNTIAPFTLPRNHSYEGVWGLHHSGYEWETDEWTWEGWQVRESNFNSSHDLLPGQEPGDWLGPLTSVEVHTMSSSGATPWEWGTGVPESATGVVDIYDGTWVKGDPFPTPGSGSYSTTIVPTNVSAFDYDAGINGSRIHLEGAPNILMSRRIAWRVDYDHPWVRYAWSIGYFPCVRAPRRRLKLPGFVKTTTPRESTELPDLGTKLQVLDRQADWNKVGNESWDENTGRLKSLRPDVWRGERKPGDPEVGFYRERMWDGTQWVEPVKMMEK